MPQDSLRSVVYRSFVTCDDPSGVVECGRIRKSKSGSQRMEHRIESRRRPENLETFLTYKAEKEEMVFKGIEKEFHSPSSFQLMEVSRGAQKLNQTIDSWSKGQSFDGQNKDIAKDLLKGAVDLQESLIMLAKLQEASHFMARLKRKQKSERGRIDEVGIDRKNSYQFGDQNCSIGFQKPRISADGSSRNCLEELKKVTRDSLASQNLLPNTCTVEKVSVSDIPSTSSSQSSNVHTEKFGCSDSSLSLRAPKKSAKGPNLIAKLMGLEEIPSKPTLQELLESEKITNRRKHIFDIDMPKLRKPLVAVQKLDPEQRTLKEILETMQFKGLLKSDSSRTLMPQSNHSYDVHSKQRFNDDFPPIVLIKPLPVGCLESEEHHTPIYQEEEALNKKTVLRKVKIKLEVQETVSKRLSHEGAQDCKEVVGKPDGKEVKTKEKFSSKTASVPVNHKPHRKDETDKKVNEIQKVKATSRKSEANKIQKVKSTSRKPADREIARSKNVSKSHNQAKTATAKLRKSNNGSNITKNLLPQKQSTSSKIISKRTTQTAITNSGDLKKRQIKKEKPVREAAAAKLVTENLRCKEDVDRIHVASENDSLLIGRNTALAKQHPTEEKTDGTEIQTEGRNTALAKQHPAEEKTDAAEIQTEDHFSNSQSSVCDVDTVLSSNYERGIESTEGAYNYGKADSKCFETVNSLKHLLLTSSSFLSHTEELFDFNVSCPTILKTSGLNDSSVVNARLSLDCANELIERRSLPDSQTTHPLLLACAGNSRIHISLDQLVEEVCHGIERLRSYSTLAGENLPLDSLYAMLERDLKCKGMVSGMWDLGWKTGFSVDEAEQVVNDIEKLVLSGLIDEVLM